MGEQWTTIEKGWITKDGQPVCEKCCKKVAVMSNFCFSCFMKIHKKFLKKSAKSKLIVG